MSAALHLDAETAPADSLAAIRDFVVARTGLAYYRGRERALARHVNRAMRRAGTPAPEQYFALIRSERGRAEIEALISDLVIGETSFFRHPAQFSAIGELILPALDRARPEGHALRIWSAACANGAEAASLALLVGRHPALQRRAAAILATDLSHQAVRRARHLVFGERDRRGLPAELDRACFEDTESGRRLAEPFRRMLRFRQHNLLSATHPEGARGAPFDLVLCRNVLIYFDAPTVRRVLANVRATMAPDGWLVVGHAEPLLACPDLFRPEWVGDVFVYSPAGASRRRRAAPATDVPFARPEERPAGTRLEGQAVDKPVAVCPAKQVVASCPASSARTEKVGRPRPSALAELYTLMAGGRREAAERFCHNRLDSAPFDPWSHYVDALVAEWSGAPEAAETALRRALFLDRKFGLARFRLSQLQMAKGARAAARRELRNVARLYADDDAAAFASAIDGLTVGALRDLVALQLERLAAP